MRTIDDQEIKLRKENTDFKTKKKTHLSRIGAENAQKDEQN